MRTNIVIDDDLIKQAFKLGFKTKKSAVNEGLKLLIQTKAQAELRKFKGKLFLLKHPKMCMTVFGMRVRTMTI